MFEDTLDKIFEVVKLQWSKEIRIQGHSLTGSLERSLEAKYIKVLKGFIIDFLANDYGNILDAGTKVFNIDGLNAMWSVMFSPLYEVLAHQNYLKAKADHQEAYAEIKQSMKR